MQSELFYNQWFGKALGFTGAFVVAPPSNTILAVFVIVGIVLGQCFDMWAAKQSSPAAKVPKSAKSKSTASPLGPHHLFLFAALGHIAKVSGTVRPTHIASAEAVMRAMKFSKTQRKDAIAAFGAGKSASFSFEKLARQFAPDDGLRSFVVHAMCDAAAITPHDKALAATVRLAGLLGVQPTAVAGIFGRALENRKAHTTQHQNKEPPKPNPRAETQPTNTHAYEVLGISPRSSPKEAKRAYRKLVSKSHPDKLPPNASEQQILAATRRMVELREALETIEQKGQRKS